MQTSQAQSQVTSPERPVIDKDDLKALREASRIVFQLYEGNTEVRAIYDFAYGKITPTLTRLFPEHTHGQEFCRRVAADSSVADYGKLHSEGYSRTYACFEMIHGAKFSGVWQTVVSQLKEGDEIILRWVASNNSNLLRDANLHNDELYLQVQRTTKSGKKQRYEYMIDSNVCFDNSARMVRRRYI